MDEPVVGIQFQLDALGYYEGNVGRVATYV